MLRALATACFAAAATATVFPYDLVTLLQENPAGA